MRHPARLVLVVILAISGLVLATCTVAVVQYSKSTFDCSSSVVLKPQSITLTSAKLEVKGQQLDNAKLIIGIGLSRSRGKTPETVRRDIVVALMTARQESGLVNVAYGHSDSLGLFQQRPSIVDSQGRPYWGTPSQIMDESYSINRFYEELEKNERRSEMSLAQAAQKVQRSKYPNAYAQWESLARNIMASMDEQAPAGENVVQDVDFSNQCLQGGGLIEAAVQAALSQVGTPYRRGGIAEDGGFDGSGLMKWAYEQAGVEIPRTSREQYAGGTKVNSLSDLQRGDLVFWATNTANPSSVYHVAMYLGNSQIIDAPRPGKPVSVQNIYMQNVIGAVRPVMNDLSFMTEEWRIPLIGATSISSDFGQRFHPVLRYWKLHDGVDFSASYGRPIVAAAPGRVTAMVTSSAGNGIHVILEHAGDGGSITTLYAHMSGFASGLQVGQIVKAGETIGFVGSTGYSTGSHLHFTVEVNGTPVDPIPFLRQRGVTV